MENEVFRALLMIFQDLVCQVSDMLNSNLESVRLTELSVYCESIELCSSRSFIWKTEVIDWENASKFISPFKLCIAFAILLYPKL